MSTSGHLCLLGLAHFFASFRDRNRAFLLPPVPNPQSQQFHRATVQFLSRTARAGHNSDRPLAPIAGQWELGGGGDGRGGLQAGEGAGRAVPRGRALLRPRELRQHLLLQQRAAGTPGPARISLLVAMRAATPVRGVGDLLVLFRAGAVWSDACFARSCRGDCARDMLPPKISARFSAWESFCDC